MEFLWFIVAGVVSGVIAGMGMGGGTLLIPILTIFFSVAQHQAQGINLFAFLPMAVVSLIIHIKNKLINFKVGIPIIITGVLTSVSASFLALSTKNRVLQILFGVFLLIIGLEQAISTLCQIIKQKYKKKIKIKNKAVYRFNKNILK